MAPPRHVIVLMMENRSFDHMLGFVPRVGDLRPTDSNPVDPTQPGSERVRVSADAEPITLIDPAHTFEATRAQMFGGRPPSQPAPMSGFVASYVGANGGDVALGKRVMQCQNPASVPVLAQLARAYCVCTAWFSSVPAPTWPNRYYLHAATSSGLVSNVWLNPFTPTIFDRLEGHGLSWRVYVGDIAQCWAIPSLGLRMLFERGDAPEDRHFGPLWQLFDDLSSGSLRSYSFVEPHYFQTPLWRATDQHPPHDVRDGEGLISLVYERLVASDYWSDSLFVVLYDEHGGFYDKAPPPTTVSPDGVDSSDPPFDFRQLGVRVPAVLVSPLIEPGTRDRNVYDHAAVPATLNRLFDLGSDAFLTERDRQSRTFEHNLTRTRPRRDTVRVSPAAGVSPAAAVVHVDTARAIEVVNGTRADEERAVLAARPPLLGVARQGLSDHQRGLAAMAEALRRASGTGRR
jgi:phospholipase C